MAIQHGTVLSIKCPHCKKIIKPPEIVKTVHVGQIVETTGTCMLCGKENYFWSRLDISVQVERADRAK